MRKIFDVNGMSCSACVSAVERAVKKVDGVEEVSVSLLTNSMTVEGEFSPANICSAVKKAGYEANEKGVKNEEQKKAQSAVDSGIKRLIASICLLLPITALAMLNMFGNSSPSFLFGEEGAFNLAFIEMILASAVLYINRAYFERGFKALWLKSPNMDTLVAVGSAASYLYGVVVIFQIVNAYIGSEFELAKTLSHSLYFEGAAMILTLISLGKTLEASSKRRATDEISKIVSLSPKTALLLKDGVEVEANIEDVAVGERYILREGDVVGIDGVIAEGALSLNESNLTGESIPLDKEVGATVLSGSVVVSGYAVIRTTKASSDSAIQRIASLVSEASSSKAPVQRIADKVAGVFVPTVFAISAITLAVWLIISKDFSTAFNYAISVLVISCPCALGLATPVAIMVGTGLAAKNGLLIKSGEYLQNLSAVKIAIFDKTGTITKGEPQITDVISDSLGEREALQLAGSLENKSSHSLSRAFDLKCREMGIEYLEVEDFDSKTAFGISGKLCKESYKIGKAEYVGEVDERLRMAFEGLVNGGKTAVYLSKNSVAIAVIGIFDGEKQGAKEGISALKGMGITPVLLTGDKRATALHLASRVGIDEVVAEVLPEDKKEVVARYKKEGLTAFIGDGVNDALAIKEADIGIAMSDGSEIAVDVADLVIVGGKPEKVAKGVEISKKVLGKIKGNLFWAFFYNALCIPVAAGALAWAGVSLNPMLASLAMSFSSLFVVINSLAIRRDKPQKKERIKVMKKEMLIEGMMCMHCVKRVSDTLNGIDGVTAKVDLQSKTAYIEVTGEVSDGVLKSAVEDQGYAVLAIK